MEEEHVTYCNECSRDTNHFVLYEYITEWGDDDPDSDVGENNYKVVRCKGCDYVHFVLETWSTLDVGECGEPIDFEHHFPSALYRRVPKWFKFLDKDWYFYQILNEIYKALANQCPKLAIMGMRALLESVMIQCCGDNGTFSKNLDAFEKYGFISKIQRASLTTALEIGHATMHRNFDPSLQHIDVCLDICENIIETIVVDKQNIERIEGSVPKRNC